jgi:hypothetical protein
VAARAATSAANTTTPTPPREPIDWAGLGRRFTGGLTASGTAIACFYRASIRDTVRVYRSLPDWATPIVWGLVVTSPIVVAAALGRYLKWW